MPATAHTHKGNPLARKLGPLPVYAWALLALGAWFLYSRLGGGSSTSDSAGSAGTADAANGQDAATAGDLPVGGGGASGDALHNALQAVSALDGGSFDQGWGWDDTTYPFDDYGSYDDPAYYRGGSVEAYQAAGIPYTFFASGFDPIPAGSQISSNDFSALNSLSPAQLQAAARQAPAQPASNRPTPQQVGPAPVVAPVQQSGQPFTPSSSGGSRAAF